MEGTGPTVVKLVCTVSKPEAVAAIVVVPGVNVVLKLAIANVFPLDIVIVGSELPTVVKDDDKLMTVS